MGDSHENLFQNLKRAASDNVRVQQSQERSTSRRLRASRRFQEPKRIRLQLVDINGVLQWEDVSGAAPNLGMFRQQRSGARADQRAIADLEFNRLPPSKITEFLEKKDLKLNKLRGLRRWDVRTGQFKPADLPERGQALVLIHGTFSSGGHLVQEFQATEEGREFLADAAKTYHDRIYAFEHATLSVGPILNAIDLDWALAGSQMDVDVISHSRGGLVTRWWSEHINPARCRRAVLVGSPLGGTGLAAPPNIRATINMLTQLGNVLGTAAGLGAMAVPVLSVVEVLLNVLTSFTKLMSKTPLVDAAMAMIPGLFAMSRVGNNPELLRLLVDPPGYDNQYYAISSDFQPEDPQWRFWQWFRKDQIANVAADIIFKGDNDLVVDTTSMTQLTDKLRIPSSRHYSFGNSATVHHLNYFRQPQTIAFLRKSLEI